MSSPLTGLRHVGALDGLRGVAVLAVLLYHGGVSWTPGGFLGVDLFFVLSGFLITTLLLREHDGTGRLNLLAFWGRRARRLLPALLLLLAGLALLAPLVLSATQRAGLQSDGLSSLFYFANWHFVVGGQDYFAQYSDPSPLLHTWSLAIEEQFYLIWPPLLALLLMLRRPDRWLFGLVGGAAVLSALWMAKLAGTGMDPSRLYFGTDTRAQTVLIGALLALVVRRIQDTRGSAADGTLPKSLRPQVRVAGFIALLLTVFAMVFVRDDAGMLYRGGLTVFAIAVAVVIGSSVLAPGGLVTAPLSWRPLRLLGIISYGVYLYHWPVFLVLDNARTGRSGLSLLVIRFAVTFVLALASYVLVEQPIRRGAVKLRLGPVMAPLVGIATVAALLLIAGTLAPAAPRPPNAELDDLPVATSTAAPVPAPTAKPAPATKPTPATKRVARGTGPLDVLVLGDSVAYTLGGALPDTSGVQFHNGATVGCGITTTTPYRYFGSEKTRQGKCSPWEQTWRDTVAKNHPDVTAVLVGRWEIVDQFLNNDWHHIGEPEYDSYLRAQLARAIAAATPAGGKVVFLTTPYYLRGERPDGGRWPEDTPERVDAYNALLRDVVAQHRDVARVVEFGDRTAGGGHDYVQTVDGVTLRYDGVHFTSAGAAWVAPWLRDQLKAAIR